ncbi:MAG: SCP2 sterol-binding domain-containing protein [Ruminiclostridium sp.]|nr:SCP2 sterol-binding domain-containing protein [Ruminiclostridium sp.]
MCEVRKDNTMAAKKTTKTEAIVTAPEAEVKAEAVKKPAAKKTTAKPAAKKPAAKKTTAKTTAAKKPAAKKAVKKQPDIVALADMLRKAVVNKDVSAINEKIAVQIKVYGEYEGYMYILVDNGTVSVEPYGYIDNDIHVDMPIDDVISIVKGKYDFKAKALSGDLYALGSLTKMLKIKEALF